MCANLAQIEIELEPRQLWSPGGDHNAERPDAEPNAMLHLKDENMGVPGPDLDGIVLGLQQWVCCQSNINHQLTSKINSTN